MKYPFYEDLSTWGAYTGTEEMEKKNPLDLANLLATIR